MDANFKLKQKKQKAKDHRIKTEVDEIQKKKNRLERIDLAIFLVVI